MSRCLEVSRTYCFDLTPKEFLGVAWIYQKEIRPILNRVPRGDLNSPIADEMIKICKEFRTALLNREILSTTWTDRELLIISNIIHSVMSDLFDVAIVNKPSRIEIDDLRSMTADLFVPNTKGVRPHLKSSLKSGKIEFSFSY